MSDIASLLLNTAEYLEKLGDEWDYNENGMPFVVAKSLRDAADSMGEPVAWRASQAEMQSLRDAIDAEREKVRVLREALEYAVKQVPEIGTVPGVKVALATTEPEDV